MDWHYCYGTGLARMWGQGQKTLNLPCVVATSLSVPWMCSWCVRGVGGLQGLGQRWEERQKPGIEGYALPMGTWAFLVWYTAHPCLFKNLFSYIPFLKLCLSFTSTANYCFFLLLVAHMIFTLILHFILIGNILLFLTERQEDLSLKQAFAIQPTVSFKTGKSTVW